MSGYGELDTPHVARANPGLDPARTGERLGAIEAKLAARQEQANVFEATVEGKLNVFDEKLDRMGGDIAAALKMVGDHINDEGGIASVMTEISTSLSKQATECQARDSLLTEQYKTLSKQHSELKAWFVSAVVAAFMGVIAVTWELIQHVFIGGKS